MKKDAPRSHSRLLNLMTVGTVLLPFLASNASADVPALLQFAERYQAPAEATPPVARTTPAKKDVKKSGTDTASSPTRNTKSTSALASRWQLKELELKRQQVTITQLEHQVSRMQKALAEKTGPVAQTPSPVPPVDLKSLQHLAQGVRQALAITPGEKQAQAREALARQLTADAQQTEKALRTDNQSLTTQLNTLNAQHTAFRAAAEKNALAISQPLATQLSAMAQDKTTLQSHLSSAQKENQMLLASTEDLKAQLGTAMNREKALLQQQGELKTQRQALQAQVDDTVGQVATLNATLTAIRQDTPATVTVEALKKTQTRQDYAAGVSLAEEILQMQNERQKWGVHTDKQTMLSGIFDTLTGHKKMTDDELNQALDASEKQVASARDNVMSEQTKKGNSYLTRFRQDKNVRQTASGAWYKVDYPGEGVLTPGAILDVVIKETLTDGTVIQDMESSGAVLSQPMDRFPPLFSEALSQLKNHGTLTLVVPPMLAYGDKGYPPNVPPNATMVYTLRIAEMYPAIAAKNTDANTNKKPIAR
ncbi:FKBP-type peptidyl-prolyl cis-trans isomerase fkpA precursor [Serratia proteamaculans]|uniref:FKBP-type peptidyl-prolyl cis-trans isomerase N-terminal domain-containing protein n=1 Tax=Serratia proteamaculans TaxID=28151 RepID=UPI0021838BC1|nr:FKBP-type peptidyl-prolyl cis-trans isomerase N-terminal domain-containing protein [Serratia proteamaculans]CAI2514096.1 FKBP-type peptidyl-prolyl cis-trans isomerase fkpA precursor [Serratia proteamaculans]